MSVIPYSTALVHRIPVMHWQVCMVMINQGWELVLKTVLFPWLVLRRRRKKRKKRRVILECGR